MLTSAGIFFPLINLGNHRGALQRLVLDSFEAADKNLNIQSAVAWGEGFTFPPEVHIRDTAELVGMGYHLTGLIRKRQALLLPDRLNKDRLAERDRCDPTCLSSVI
jgi:hypothetical protein